MFRLALTRLANTTRMTITSSIYGSRPFLRNSSSKFDGTGVLSTTTPLGELNKASGQLPRMGIQFRCKVCDHTLQKTFTRQSYEKGIVIIRCDSCVSLHLIADNLGWFKDLTQDGKTKNIVDMLHAKGETVHRVTTAVSDEPAEVQEAVEPSLSTSAVAASGSSSSAPKIYTRTGDRGTSVLLAAGSGRLPKDSLVFDVLGTLDELSSSIGLILTQSTLLPISKQLESIQCSLFEIGSCVAAGNRSARFAFNDAGLITDLEAHIDQMTGELPELRNFILPGGGSETASRVHFARAVCRRCERLMAKWLSSEQKEQQQETLMGIYLNRLSDYLFTLARYVASKEGHKEIIYRPRK